MLAAYNFTLEGIHVKGSHMPHMQMYYFEAEFSLHAEDSHAWL